MRSFYLRALLQFPFLVILFGLPSFLRHMEYYLSGNVIDVVIKRNWWVMSISIVFFLLFLLPLFYRKHVDWKSSSLYVAFIISLFVEMYGIPLTLYLSSAAFSDTNVPPDQTIYSFSTFGTTFTMDFWTIFGGAITAIGTIIIFYGWYSLYKQRNKPFATHGPYRYSRHPQYLGFLLVVGGWFIGWPSLLTTAMFPLLFFAYYQAAKKEEQYMLSKSKAYRNYMKETPMFL